MSSVTDKIARLSPEKQMILEKLLKKQGLDISRLPIAVQPRDTNIFPLSFSQQRMWFLHQIDPENTAYNCSAAWRMTGELSLPALQKAATDLVQRHEVLRTTFITRNGQPFQVVASQADVALHALDLRMYPAYEQLAQVQSIATSEAQRPFDLTRGPLLRMFLLRLGQEDHVLLITMHHIISDGWSLGIMAREMATLYKVYAEGEEISLARSPIQYVDYAVWQQQWLQGDRLAGQLSYWKEQLAGAPKLLTLPMSKPRPAVWSNQGAVRRFTLSKELSEALKALARQEGATLFMTLLSAFTVLLFRYTDRRDILLGTPIANRNRHETTNVIGCFINTLTLRTKPAPGMSFRQLLAQVQKTTTDAYAHQDLPFEKLIEALNVERDASSLPLIQVFFVLQNIKIDALELPGLSLKPLEITKRVTQFDLTLEISEEPERLAGHFEYSTSLFDEPAIEYMISHWQTLLAGIVSQPDLPLEQLPLLTEKEYQLLTGEWNATQRRYPESEQCLHTLFEKQVERTPDALAVLFAEQCLTYRKLDTQANQLARHLVNKGVGPDVPVGICMERSLEMLVALLGILKAEGAFIPLDPEYPEDRLTYICQEARVPIVLTQTRLRNLLSTLRIPCLCVDTPQEWPPVSVTTRQRKAPLVGENLAYIIYTSGSTGKPKGAMNTHRGIVNRLLWGQNVYALITNDRVLQKTPYSFDVSVWEFFWPLISGAVLVVAKPGGHRDPYYLSQYITEQAITTLHFVPSMFHYFLEVVGAEQCRSIRQVICSGEALMKSQQYEFFTRFNADLINLYGPTEASIEVTEWVCSPEDLAPTIPIGRPIANIQMRILDARLQPVPIGVVGELFIAGVGLGRGYLNCPDLTAGRFVPDPYSQQPGARMYHTGDLARYRPDGAIEYLGRLDFQIKLRGQRLELGEIETALQECAGIQDAAVVLWEHGVEDKQLVAYLIPDQPPVSTKQHLAQPDEIERQLLQEVRATLSKRLPHYMVPSAYVLLERFPLTTSGKLDRRALPSPQERTVYDDKPFIAPSTPLEQMLADIWQQILNVPQVGIHDNFFDRGGNSLLAIQLMTHIQQRLGIPAPLSIIFQAPTLQEMAGLLSVRQQASDWSPLVAIQSQGSRCPFFCVHPAPGNVFCYTELARMLGKDQPFYGLQARGIDGHLPPLNTIEEMAALYIQAIRTIQPEGPYLLGGHSLGGCIAFEMSRQLQHQGSKVALLAILDTPAPLMKVTSTPSLSGEREELARLLADGTAILAQFSGKNLAIAQETLQQMEPAAQLEYARHHLQLHGFLSQGEDMGPIQGFLQVQKASIQALAAYTPQLYSPASTSGEVIALFRSQEWQQKNTDDDLDNQFCDRSLGWSRLLPQSPQIYDVPGNHITMLTPPSVHVLAEWLGYYLKQIQRD